VVGSALIALAASAQSVSVTEGNIYVTDKAGKAKQLTFGGNDVEAVLSPDAKWVVFVRRTSGKMIETGSGADKPTELWQIGANGKDPTLLVRCRATEKIEDLIAGFEKPQFSSDGRYVFFMTPAWATSSAVHVVDTTNAKEHFFCPGNDLEVLYSGEYRDCLVVQQHRYFLGGGSFDWYWLFRPDGKEVGPIGESINDFKDLYLKR
jgi:dipeptidyl aminopeptidase/acylaminoacyl peptidase